MSRYSAEVLVDQPVIYLPLDETSGTTASDDTGNGHTGTYAGGFTLGGAALVSESSGAVTLNGSTGQITIPDVAALDLGDVFTIEAWVRLTTLISQQIFSKGAGAPGVFCDTGGVLTLSKAGTGTIAQATVGPTVGAVTHIVMAKDGSDIAIIVNGVDVTSLVGNQTCVSTATDVYLGRNSGGTNPLSGEIGHVAIYDYRLSLERAQAHFDVGSGVLQPASADSLTATPASATAISVTPDFGASAVLMDDFNRADEGHPMTGWAAYGSSGLKVVSDQMAPTDTGDNQARLTTTMSDADVEAYITIATHPATGGQSVLMARVDPAANTFYSVEHNVQAGTDFIDIARTVSGSWTRIGGSFSQEMAAGDKLGIRCMGATIEAWVFTGGEWVLVGSATDSAIAGDTQNSIAFYNYGNGTSVARYDDLYAGAVNEGLAPASADSLTLTPVT